MAYLFNMEFFIKKNATLPLLKMQIVKDGESSLDNFSEIIEDSLIYFSMKDTLDGRQVILNKKGGFVEKVFVEPNSKLEYYIYYKFSSFDTRQIGKFEAEFTLITDDGDYILPHREKLYINVTN